MRRFKHYYSVGLLIALMFVLTSCGYSEAKKGDAQTELFQYSINVGYPDEYNVIYERTQSYFMDAKGDPILYFGGRIAAGAGWGTGAQNTSLSETNVIPAAFKVRWFSPVENQFWEGEFKLPQQELYQLVKTGYRDAFHPEEHKNYSTFIVNVAPGGLVVLWLRGGAQTIQVGEFQAHKIDMDWQEFAQNTFIYAPNKTRAEYIAEAINSEKIRQEIKTGTLPTDSAPWKLLQRKYLWRMQLNAPFTLKDYRVWYANAESLYTYADQVNEYQNRAVPYQIFFTFLKPNQQMDQMMLILDKESTVDAFKKLGGSEKSKLDLSFELSEDMQKAEVYLRNKDQAIKLKVEEVYLDDL